MSDIYSVSLDHLLKEDKSMNQTYQEFLEESTNTVKAKKNLGKIILLSTYFIVWVVAMLIFWFITNPMLSGLGVTLRWILLPALLLVTTVTVAKNNYWGKGNWLCVLAGAVTFLSVPYTHYLQELDMVTITFQFPNFPYMIVGAIISAFGITLGTFWNKRKE